MGKTSTSGQGRPKGVRNKATKDVKALAGKYGPEAIEMLADLMRNGESEAARVAAARDLLDRAYGKAAATVDLNAKGDITVRIMDRWAK